MTNKNNKTIEDKLIDNMIYGKKLYSNSTNYNYMQNAIFVISLDQQYNIKIIKDRLAGCPRDLEDDDLINQICFMLVKNKCKDSMYIFQESMKIELFNAIKKILDPKIKRKEEYNENSI